MASVASVSSFRELRDFLGGFGLSAKHSTCMRTLHRLQLVVFWSWSKSSAQMWHPPPSSVVASSALHPREADAEAIIVDLWVGIYQWRASSCVYNNYRWVIVFIFVQYSLRNRGQNMEFQTIPMAQFSSETSQGMSELYYST